MKDEDIKEDGWYPIGAVGVDSGCLMIGDPCYLDDETDWNPKLYEKWVVGALCSAGLSVQMNEMCFNQAVIFSSGFGDGVYPVDAFIQNYGDEKEPDYRIKEVRIRLIEDDCDCEHECDCNVC